MATIEPLRGKYYGTVVRLESGDQITVWVMDNFKPSQRQLDYLGITLEEAKEDDYFCDSHFETETGYKIAEALVEVLNRMGL